MGDVHRLPARCRDDLTVDHRVIHGYRRAFFRTGSGPALLLLHGIGDNADSWRHLIPELARDHLVIAPDLLGHGRSDKPRADYSVAAYACGMRDLLSVLGIDRVTIVGHSLGGGVAAQFAYQFPERCERLVLVASGGVGRDVTVFLRLAASPLADLAVPFITGPVVRLAGRGFMQALRALGTGLGRDADEVNRVLDALPDIGARRAFVRTLRCAVDWRGQHATMLDRCYLAQGMPTLLIWGTHDAVIPVSHATIAHAALPKSRLEIFPEAGHFPHHTDPERFLAVLRQFLATTEPASYEAEEWRVLLRAGRPASPVDALTGLAVQTLAATSRSGT